MRGEGHLPSSASARAAGSAVPGGSAPPRGPRGAAGAPFPAGRGNTWICRLCAGGWAGWAEVALRRTHGPVADALLPWQRARSAAGCGGAGGTGGGVPRVPWYKRSVTLFRPQGLGADVRAWTRRFRRHFAVWRGSVSSPGGGGACSPATGGAGPQRASGAGLWRGAAAAPSPPSPPHRLSPADMRRALPPLRALLRAGAAGRPPRFPALGGLCGGPAAEGTGGGEVGGRGEEPAVVPRERNRNGGGRSRTRRGAASRGGGGSLSRGIVSLPSRPTAEGAVTGGFPGSARDGSWGEDGWGGRTLAACCRKGGSGESRDYRAPSAGLRPLCCCRPASLLSRRDCAFMGKREKVAVGFVIFLVGYALNSFLSSFFLRLLSEGLRCCCCSL